MRLLFVCENEPNLHFGPQKISYYVYFFINWTVPNTVSNIKSGYVSEQHVQFNVTFSFIPFLKKEKIHKYLHPPTIKLDYM